MIDSFKVGDSAVVTCDSKYHKQKGKIVSVTPKTGYRGTYKFNTVELKISDEILTFQEWQLSKPE